MIALKNKLLDIKVEKLKHENQYFDDIIALFHSRKIIEKFHLIDRIRKVKNTIHGQTKAAHINKFEEILIKYIEFINLFKDKVLVQQKNQSKYKHQSYEKDDRREENFNKLYLKLYDKNSKKSYSDLKVEDVKNLKEIDIKNNIEALNYKLELINKIILEKILYKELENDLLRNLKTLKEIIKNFKNQFNENIYLAKDLFRSVFTYIENLFYIGPPKKIVHDFRIIDNIVEEFNSTINVF